MQFNCSTFNPSQLHVICIHYAKRIDTGSKLIVEAAESWKTGKLFDQVPSFLQISVPTYCRVSV